MDTSIFALSNVSSYQRITAHFVIARKHKLTQKINQAAYKQRNVQFSLSVAKRGAAILNYELTVGKVPLDLSVRVEIPTERGRF